TPLKVLRLLLLGASSYPEEPNKSKEALHELHASLTFKPSMNSSRTELLANLDANLWKQSLQGVLNGHRKVGV
nr:hypothetical protein [Tanacetum cinerariifolium]